MDNDDPLSKFRGVLPSRAELCQLVLFGTSEKIRKAAQALLDTLPPMTAKEKDNWASAVWASAKLPSESDLEKSPIGRATLAMLRANAPVAAQKAEPAGTVAPEPVAAVAEPEIPPLQPPPCVSDDLGERMEQERAAKRERERTAKPWKWDMLKPSAPDKSLRPLAPSDDFDNNRPLY
jgi:hypothetical protein